MARHAGDVAVEEGEGPGTPEQRAVPGVDVAGVVRPVKGAGLAAGVFVADVAGVVDRFLQEEIFSGASLLLRGNLRVTAAAGLRLDMGVQKAYGTGRRHYQKQGQEREED